MINLEKAEKTGQELREKGELILGLVGKINNLSNVMNQELYVNVAGEYKPLDTLTSEEVAKKAKEDINMWAHLTYEELAGSLEDLIETGEIKEVAKKEEKPDKTLKKSSKNTKKPDKMKSCTSTTTLQRMQCDYCGRFIEPGARTYMRKISKTKNVYYCSANCYALDGE